MPAEMDVAETPAGKRSVSNRLGTKGQTDLLPPELVSKRQDYQRLRPPVLFPRPPPPSRLAIGLASLTTKVRPSS